MEKNLDIKERCVKIRNLLERVTQNILKLFEYRERMEGKEIPQKKNRIEVDETKMRKG